MRKIDHAAIMGHSWPMKRRALTFFRVFRPKILVPIVVVVVLLVALGLNLKPKKTSTLTLHLPQTPSFTLPQLGVNAAPNFASTELAGQVVLVNFFASWCTTCQLEHALLVELHKQLPEVKFIGIAYRDSADKAQAYLARAGNPYDTVLLDENGQGAVAWGTMGVPETFVISRNGVIEYRQIGPISVGQAQGQLRFLLTSLLKDVDTTPKPK
jgi:cytochrome c biogenesis protein CcmG/thiol:disulfide interchange protein DsbE